MLTNASLQWSIGVITYILLAGSQPFWGPIYDMEWPKRRKIMIDRIMRCEYKKMKRGIWDSISEEAKAFVASLLQLDPKLRPTAEEALRSKWMKKRFPKKDEEGEAGRDEDRIQRQREVRTLTIAAIAYKLHYDDILSLSTAFRRLDTNNTSKITFGDVCNALLETNKFTKEGENAHLSDLLVSAVKAPLMR